MAKLIMMKGLPASGKTTKAVELLSKYGNYVRVNRDDLRSMLHTGLDWSGKREKVTMSAQMAIVRELLATDQSVILDDTNLTKWHLNRWSSVAKEADAKFEVVSVDTPFEECIERDKRREKTVGAHVITSMALSSGLFPYRNIIICDVDGTVANINHRLLHIKGEHKDWRAFFEDCWMDGFRDDIINRVLEDAMDNDAQIVFLSGRSDVVRETTESWLEEAFGFEPLVLMRPHWDRRPDVELKAEMFDRHFGNYNIVRVYDDRPRLIRMWEGKDLDVVDCGDGQEF